MVLLKADGLAVLPNRAAQAKPSVFGDLGNIHLIEIGPGFQQSGNPFLPVCFAPLFERLVAVQPLTVGLQGIGKGHFSPRNRRLRRGALPLLLVEIAQPQFGDADSVGFERFPNQLAAHANSRIIVA